MSQQTAPQQLRLILASASPRRRELLTQAGYTFTVEAADLDESRHAGEAASTYVLRLAEEKATAVLNRHLAQPSNDATPLVVVGADTTVVCDGQLLGKPGSVDDARRMLRMLSARVHLVLTGVAVASARGVSSAIEETAVTFAEIPDADLETYLATGEPMDKAGAYGIQGYAARWVPRIEGCYFNVMGLPLARTVRLIESNRY